MSDEEHGHYEKVGDIEEWRWDEGHEPKVTVPEGSFDPRDPKPEPKAEPKKAAPKATAPSKAAKK